MNKVLRYLKNKKKKTDEKITKKLAPRRLKKLNNTNFSILANNCWGGKVYQYFGVPYQSPTVGLYFYAEEYMKFLRNYRLYFSSPITFISPEQSKYYDQLKKKNQLNVPIGKILDAEIVFLHYKTEEEARQKWERRVSRINYDNLIVKFSFMNECTDEMITEFDKFPFNKKLVFVNKHYKNVKSSIYIPGYDGCDSISDDTTRYDKYVNLIKLINK